MTKIIREVATVGNEYRCVVRAGTYSHTFEYIAELVQAAKSDFPALEDRHIEIMMYGGDRYRGTIGIEFDVQGDVPDTYTAINQVELTLG
jgi:hypothetical protein